MNSTKYMPRHFSLATVLAFSLTRRGNFWGKNEGTKNKKASIMGNSLERQGKKWSRDETILALELYCRTPFGRINRFNPDIVHLAELLGRSSGSVSLKMANLAHYDPDLRARDISGMAHGSKLDEEVFEEFYQDLDELAYKAQFIKSKMGIHQNVEPLASPDTESIPPGESLEYLLKVRTGQPFFRTSVLVAYGRKCCITDLAIPELLIASHIKPWAVCMEKAERTNPRNGLCLNSFHDRAFDQGFITIDKNYRIIISSRLYEAEMDRSTREWFMSYKGKTIDLPDKFLPSKIFIEYHNDLIFKP